MKSLLSKICVCMPKISVTLNLANSFRMNNVNLPLRFLTKISPKYFLNNSEKYSLIPILNL